MSDIDSDDWNTTVRFIIHENVYNTQQFVDFMSHFSLDIKTVNDIFYQLVNVNLFYSYGQ